MGETQTIQSLDRGLLLLETVGQADEPLSLVQLTEVLGIDRSSVFRLAATLCRRGFLVQLPESKMYTLGSTVWRMAERSPFSGILLRVGRKHMDALAKETGETTHLAVREGCKAVLVERLLATQAIGVTNGDCGTSVEIYCTSVGKALIADFDLDGLRRLFADHPLQRFTEKTIVTLEALAAVCETTRARGFAMDDEEEHEGVRCLAVPVRDVDGKVVAAIGISAPLARMRDEAVVEIAEKVKAQASAISRLLGYREKSKKENRKNE